MAQPETVDLERERQKAIAIASVKAKRKKAAPKQYTDILGNPVEGKPILDRVADSKLYAGLQGALDTMTFGFDDEIVNTVGNAVGAGYIAPDRREEHKDAVREEHPVSFGTGQVAGGFVPLAPAVTAPTMLGKVAKGAAIGGVAGGVYGVGDGDGDLSQRAENAKVHAGYGVVGGAVLPPLAAGGAAVARTGGRAIADAYAKGVKKFNPNSEMLAKRNAAVAEAAVKRSMQRSQVTPQQFAEKAAEYGDKPVTVAELAGQDALNTATALSRSHGTTPEKAASVLEERAAGLSGRLVSDIQETTGLDPAAVSGDLDGMVAAARSRAAPAYDFAMRQPFEETNRLLELRNNSPTLNSAYDKALRAVDDKKATRGGAAASPLELWDETKRALDSEILRVEKQVQKGERDAGELMRLTQLRDAFVDELDNIVPEYAMARDMGGDAPRMNAAFRSGQAALRRNKNAEDIAEQLSTMGDNERMAFQSGVVRWLSDQFEQGSTQTARFAYPDFAKKIKAVFGDEQGDAFLQRMAQETEMRNKGARINPNVGSVTAQAMGAPSPAMDEAVRAGANMMTGNKVGLLTQGINVLRRSGYNQGQKDAIGDLLMSSPGDAAERLGAPMPPIAGGPIAAPKAAAPKPPKLEATPEVTGGMLGGAVATAAALAPEAEATGAARRREIREQRNAPPPEPISLNERIALERDRVADWADALAEQDQDARNLPGGEGYALDQALDLANGVRANAFAVNERNAGREKEAIRIPNARLQTPEEIQGRYPWYVGGEPDNLRIALQMANGGSLTPEPFLDVDQARRAFEDVFFERNGRWPAEHEYPPDFALPELAMGGPQ